MAVQPKEHTHDRRDVQRRSGPVVGLVVDHGRLACDLEPAQDRGRAGPADGRCGLPHPLGLVSLLVV
mgnify:CR=1 FL=1